MRRLLIIALFAGCGGGIDPASSDAYDKGSAALSAIHEVLQASDALLDLNVTKTSDENATAIQTRALAQLNGCGSVAKNGTRIDLTFTAAGCKLGPLFVSGALSLDVVAAAGTVTVTETFAQVTFLDGKMDAKTLSGTVTVATQNIAKKTINVSLSDSGTDPLAGSALSANLTLFTETVDGMANVDASGVTIAVMLNAVVWRSDDCSPRSGSIEITQGPTHDTVTFATVGQVQLSWGQGTRTTGFPGCYYL